MKPKGKMRVISLHVPERFLRELDLLVEAKLYPHRAEAIRLAIRDLIQKETLNK